MNLKGTQSEANLKTALAGESMARNKYTFYAAQARNDGYEELALLFDRMAQNECAHAKVWFNYLHKSKEDNGENIIDAASSENKEWSNMYPKFAQTAREEGLEELAQSFEMIAKIEKDHEHQFLTSFVRYKTNKMDAADEPMEPSINATPGYRCMFCGAVYEERPDVCSVCHSIGSFEDCMIEN